MTPNDNNGNKSSNVPSVLEMTMMRPPAVVANVPALPASQQLAHVGAAAPPGLEAAPTVWTLLQALRRRLVVALCLATVAGLLTAAAVFVVMPPKFIAVANLHVASSRGPAGLGGNRDEDAEFVLYKGNLPALIKSPLILASALNQNVTPTKSARDLTIVRDRGSDAIEWLERGIKTDYNLGPEILKVSLGAERGDEVAELLNSVVVAFLHDLDQGEKTRNAKRVEELQKNQLELEQELGRFRRQLGDRERLAGLGNTLELAKKFELASQKLQATEKEAIQHRLSRIAVENELQGLRERQKNIDALPVSDEQLDIYLQNDPQAQNAFSDLVKATKDIDEVKRVAPNADASVLRPYLEKRDRAKQRVDTRREELRPEMEQRARLKMVDDIKFAVVALSDKLSTQDRQQTVLNEMVKAATEEVSKHSSNNQNIPIDIINLRDKITNLEVSTGKIAQEVTLIRATPGRTRVTLLQRATEPQAKDISRQTKIAAAGGVGMFGLVLIGVAFLEFRSRKVNSSEEVVRGLGLPVLGTVPAMPAPARKPLPGAASQLDVYWQNQLMESIDGIRAVLLHASRGDDLRVLMVTSATSGEGKTSLASQLAASLARSWKKTLLIDGDLRNPAAHRLFNVPLDPGLSEVLRSDAEPAQAIKATSMSRLWVMPAGHWDAHAVQALAHDHARSVIQTLKQQYDFIVIDSPPVLPVADALLLGQHADGVLFAVMRDVSRLPAVHAAQQRLQNLGIRTLGSVVIGEKSNLGHAGYQYAMASSGK